MSTNPFDTIQNRVSELLGAKGLQSLENPITQLLKQGLQDMEFVSLEDFETQRQVLERLREKVSQLEAKVAELEAKRP